MTQEQRNCNTKKLFQKEKRNLVMKFSNEWRKLMPDDPNKIAGPNGWCDKFLMRNREILEDWADALGELYRQSKEREFLESKTELKSENCSQLNNSNPT
jgi:hypothetical protein